MRSRNSIILFLMLSCLNLWALDGNVAIIADGNSPDPDDISGTSASIVMLKIFGAESRLVHYTHSCDLSGYHDREEMMRRSLFETAEAWGGFDTNDFFNFNSQRELASDHLAARINEASSSSLLYIIAAGETDLLYEAMEKANLSQRQYVRYITHHVANDVGDYHDLTDIMALPGVPSVSTFELRIHDQNENLRKLVNEYYWTRDHGDARVNKLWDFHELMSTEINDFPYLEGKVDISDAGMVWYWLTNFTDQDCSYTKFENKLNEWLSQGSKEGTYLFKNRATNNYMDSDGSVIKAKVLTGNADQQWRLVISAGSKYNIDCNFDGRGMISAEPDNVIKGNSLQPISTLDKYEWTMEEVEIGIYRFKNVSTSKYLAENRTTHELEQTGWDGSRSQWIVQYIGVKSASINQPLENTEEAEPFSIYPNPACNQVTVKGGLGNLAVYSLSGSILMQTIISSNLQTVDLSHLSSGIYIVKIGSETTRLVIQ